MALKVTVEDLETGEKGERVIPDDDYMLITSGSVYLDGTQMYQRTHVLTIKGLKNGIPVLSRTPAPTDPTP